MAFNIEPCEIGDLYDISKIFAEATGGLMTHLLPECSSEEKIQYMTDIHTKEISKPGRQCFKVLEAETKTTVAMMIFHIPYTLAPSQTPIPAYGTDVTPPRGANLEACNAVWGGMAVTQAKNLDHNTMFFVNALAVSPAYQRQGLGTCLLHICTDLADRSGSKTYIEASTAGAPLYQRLGWEAITSEDETAAESGLKYMLRNPQRFREGED